MNRLRELRENLGLRQIDVSNATGIDQKTLSNYETGKTNPDSYALISLANFFNVSIDYIVGRTEISLFNREDVSKKIDSIKKDLDDIKRYL
ncbi:MAG: helix-turn-helix transcriptional regulator [Clostridia bacterium]|nr:helix-turn-helix transcriptional regulator [Clostridia bacterium]